MAAFRVRVVATIVVALGLATCSCARLGSGTAATPPPPGFVSGRVTAIGDSIMVDTKPDLVAVIPHIAVNAMVGRPWDVGVAVARHLRATDSLGTTVIIDLGTNGPIDMSQFEAMMKVLSGATLVVFVTVHLPTQAYYWGPIVNDTLQQGVKKYANSRLADFNALADANPQWFGADGIHMPIGGAGPRAMARLIANTIKAAEGRIP